MSISHKQLEDADLRPVFDRIKTDSTQDFITLAEVVQACREHKPKCLQEFAAQVEQQCQLMFTNTHDALESGEQERKTTKKQPQSSIPKQ